MLILAIETSCDDTCAAVIKTEEADSNKTDFNSVVLSSIVSSQAKKHAQYGGIYPSLAAREHEKNLPKVLKIALKEAGLKSPSDVDYIAVTKGPGLAVSLWKGVNFANQLSEVYNKPLIPVNHMEGHILSNWLKPVGINKKINKKENAQFFPSVCLVVSGGHTELILMKDYGKYELIGKTRDDAAGEAFDKISRILDLGYPGGPAISNIVEKQSSKIKNKKPDIKLPRPMINSKDFDFSFSGLKTAVLYLAKGQNQNSKNKKIPILLKAQIAAEAQDAIVDVLVSKTIRAAKKYKVKSIMLSGGVSANKLLREKLVMESNKEKIPVFIPELEYTMDNAAMIGIAAYIKVINRDKEPKQKEVEANANWELV
ncbi:MAG: tRNA (adenosine(37)-N6)-threonylcarbamoyltransferase complex transferase subunit TsaD [Candidatus Yanofskybacteria bacterium CG10_big_fil_rev_8_21_14_0_10_36_16]|uniref:tRNA N6-adenosine threonylcarbamoyltransferase n=1 Tax=Candidatus Yanofskybacteria bacterium CG10_big_fil_rev_8_21_14_0_10_36_16 TaxID=1975096 RepID=A0A2J0Q6B4_9BACT|nr:MAG: tRNA (adenosine(37)-N6)-threonylcarbamoyltransferase complex transferase subunit TsaD [Candidatus Yanofskybacteria bacterium CG10_big_fil_rev_8_21_14_0_10_36_16]